MAVTAEKSENQGQSWVNFPKPACPLRHGVRGSVHRQRQLLFLLRLSSFPPPDLRKSAFLCNFALGFRFGGLQTDIVVKIAFAIISRIAKSVGNSIGIRSTEIISDR